MNPLIEAPPAATPASRTAQSNLAANQAAFEHQGFAFLLAPPPESSFTFEFARDGALHARDALGRWFDDCSVPAAASRRWLESFSPQGRVVAALALTSAATVTHVLSRLRPDQALLLLLPESACAHIIFSCGDFSAAIAARRLFLCSGEDWASQLADLFIATPGLPTPQQFLRIAAVDEDLASRIINAAQAVFSAESARRADLAQLARTRSAPVSTRICLVAGSHFRLWEDVGDILIRAAAPNPGSALLDLVHLDIDNPASASALALAAAAADCGLLVTANRSRPELPPVLSDSIRVATWQAAPITPQPGLAHDILLLADPAWRPAALAKGWSESQIRLAGLPQAQRPHRAGAGNGLALIADTLDISAPPADMSYSSHRVLWEGIRDELLQAPWQLGTDPAAYLRSRMERAAITDAGFSVPLFIDGLVVPACQQGWARAICDAGIPLRLFGANWTAISALSHLDGGAIGSRQDLEAALASAAAILHPLPVAGVHGVDTTGLAVVRTLGQTRLGVLRHARAALQPGAAAPGPAAPPLSAELLSQLARGA